MSNRDIVDEAFLQFVQQFDTEEQRVLLAFYRELVGKRKIPYKIKDRNFFVNVQMCQSFAVDIEFQDVLIEDGRHPKEIFMDSLRGEVLPEGRFRLSFINRLAPQSDGQQPKESSFSFSSLRGSVRLWDYQVHTLKLSQNVHGLPWNLMYESFSAIEQKMDVLGSSYLNYHERKALDIFNILRPYMQLYLMPCTKIGFGKTTVLFDKELISWNADRYMDEQAAEFFAEIGLRRLSSGFQKGAGRDRSFIQEMLYTMSTLKGNAIYRKLKNMVMDCGRSYRGIYEADEDMNMFRTYVREKISRVFETHEWKGAYPFFMTVVAPDFIEVSSIYKKQYTYLNEKTKYIYFDFVESIVDNQYRITPITGMILPKNLNIDYRKCTSMDCFFFDGGRRNGAVFEDLAIEESMSRKEIREKIIQLGQVLELQMSN